MATNYTYDEIDQLKSEISSNQFGVHDLYTYDANGNRATKLSAIGGLTEYGYDDADKLMSVSKSTGTTTYQYDACGRPTNIGSRVLNWGYEDRLTSLNGGGTTASTYGYNGVGSRVSKSNSNGSRTYKRNGVGVTAPVLSDGVSTMVPGISEKPSGVGTNTILTDRLGSMKGMANGGSVTETAEFDAFGKVVAHGNPTSTQKGFASAYGYQEDGESGYKLLGYRYYDPETGRFLSRDPIRSGNNWYSYCENNPLKAVDPSGLERITLDPTSDDPLQKELCGEMNVAIAKIAEVDKEKALELSILLAGGRISVETDMNAKYGGFKMGNNLAITGTSDGIIINAAFFSRYKNLRKGGLGDSITSDPSFALAATLVHELQHWVDQEADEETAQAAAIDFIAAYEAAHGGKSSKSTREARRNQPRGNANGNARKWVAFYWQQYRIKKWPERLKGFGSIGFF